MRFTILVMLGTLVAAGAAPGQDPPAPPWALGRDDVVLLHLPAAIRNKVDLDYDDSDSIRGVPVDLNRDGIEDYLVQSAPRLCGNGGCPYALFDGATGSEIGHFFGNVLYVRAELRHAYPLVDTYSNLSAGSANYTTYAFDRTAYVAGATRNVEGVSLDSLVTKLRRIPRWRPRRSRQAVHYFRRS